MERNTTWTLSELQRQVKSALAERFALPVWVTAEISELKVNYSGHCYMELVEKGERDGVPKAQARAVIWRSLYPRLSGYFEAETGRRLGAGLKVLAKVLVTYHELYGFSLQIVDLDAAYTLGDVERQRQQTIARLKQEGVWEMNRETVMPVVVQRVAVVSSRQAAGYQDFCKELNKSPYRFSVRLFDAFMQGAAAEDSIVAALGEIAGRAEEFDAVVLIRGGGSASDLNCFDSYRLCCHVAQFPLPVLTGIGHDKDTSVADRVAHTALKTPTAVAGWLVERMAQTEGWLDAAAQTLHDAAVAAAARHRLVLERLRGDLQSVAGNLLTRHRLHAERLQGELHDRTLRLLADRRGDAGRLAERLSDEAARFAERQRMRLEAAAELVESRSPGRILRLGFSIVRSGGRVLTSAASARAGDRVEVELSDGILKAVVQSAETDKKPVKN